MLFGSWRSLLGVIAVGGSAYVALVILLQCSVATLSVRSERVRKRIMWEPTLLLHRDKMLDGAQRVIREEVDSVACAAGIASVAATAPWCWHPTRA